MHESKENIMVIGVAGGVGSGKSTVLDVLEKEYHAHVCMADELGHMAMKRGTDAYLRIVERFGDGILLEDGEIDRNALAEIVYQDKGCLTALNGIIHPFVKREIRRQMEDFPPERIFVLETAILFETRCDELCDEVWGVITEDETRIRRLSVSRGYTREKAEYIMKSQMSNAELARRCDYVLVNDGAREELLYQIHEHMDK